MLFFKAQWFGVIEIGARICMGKNAVITLVKDIGSNIDPTYKSSITITEAWRPNTHTLNPITSTLSLQPPSKARISNFYLYILLSKSPFQSYSKYFFCRRNSPVKFTPNKIDLASIELTLLPVIDRIEMLISHRV
jgi:hypothetical protein